MYLGLTSLPIIVFERINVEKTGFNLVLGKVEPCRYHREQHNTLRLSGIEPLHTVSQNPQQCRLKVHAFTIGSVTWGMFRPFMQFFFWHSTKSLQLGTSGDAGTHHKTRNVTNSPVRQFYDLRALKINVKNTVTD